MGAEFPEWGAREASIAGAQCIKMGLEAHAGA
jgi:hypothetical protein